jgi:LmbE family N-acetylglucosaminyl deacetylase
MAFPNLAIDEGLEPHVVSRVYLFFSAQPNAWVDVTGTIERKIAALREHVSQIRQPDDLEERIRSWARESGEPVGVEAAEAFRVVRIE